MFKVEATFDKAKVHNYISKRIEERTSEIVAFLRKKGIGYTELARSKTLAGKPYNNITFNLVSSVGFSIVKSRVVVESYFPLLETGKEGQAKGIAVSEKAAKEFCGPNDIVLILAAGEDYASFVQGKGFDVISASSIEFESFLNTIWRGNR